jgi:peptidyl-tRNA hydrolase
VGVIAANLVHAAGESSPGGLPEGTRAVVLSVPDASAIEALRERLLSSAVEHKAIVETEGTYAGETMAIGVVPGRKEVLRGHFACLPLLR